MKKKILVTLRGESPSIPEMKKVLEDAGFEIKQADVLALTEDGLIEQARDCDAVIAGPENWTACMFQQLPQLKCIMKSGAGLDAIDLEAATKCGVAIANTPGQNAQAVAEMAAAMILSLLRRNIYYNEVVHSGKWTEQSNDVLFSHELSTRTVGMMGFGAIAKNLAQMLSGFGCRFLAYDVNPDLEAARRLRVKLVSFEELLKQSDIISLHVPLTAETRHCMNARTFAMMKSEAVLVNTCRGGVICEEDLYKALKDNVIRAAAMDVCETEPIEADNPLLTLDNIQFTPHTATSTFEALENMYMACAKQMIQFFDGDTVQYIVNPDYIDYIRR